MAWAFGVLLIKFRLGFVLNSFSNSNFLINVLWNNRQFSLSQSKILANFIILTVSSLGKESFKSLLSNTSIVVDFDFTEIDLLFQIHQIFLPQKRTKDF
jgi:hypothetical protein